MQVEVYLSAPLTEGADVVWGFANGTATGADYGFCSGPCIIQPLHFNPGITSVFIPFFTVDDALDEADETFSLTLGPTLTTNTNLVLGTLTNHIHTIIDNDPPPTVGFQSATSSLTEANSSHSITVQLSASSGQTVTVNWARFGGTATPGSSAASGADYSQPVASGTFTFNPGQTAKTIDLTVFDDFFEEANETVIFILSSPANATLATSTHTFTIVDNDTELFWGVAQTNVSEALSGVSIPLRLSRALSVPVTVQIASISYTADSGVDYTNATPSVTFSPGQTNISIFFQVLPDTLDEFDEIADLDLRNPVNAQIFGPSNCRVTILDDDAVGNTMSFYTSLVTVNESVGVWFVDVRLARPSGRVVWTSIATGGTAGYGADYTLETVDGLNLNLLTFNEGQTNATFHVVVNNDTLFEAQETILLTLSGINGASPGAITNLTIRVNDDDPAPTAAFGNFSTSFGEASTSPSIPVVLSAPAGLPVKVNVAVTGGTATGGGVDFSLNEGTVYFNTGETQKNVNLTIINDLIDEDSETFTLTLSPGTFVFPSDGYAAIFVSGITNRTFDIADDDPPPTASIQQLFFVVSEGQSTNATIRLTAPSSRNISFNVVRTLGNASNEDITTSPSTVNYLPGETQKVVTVTALNDSLVEGDEGFLLTMINPIAVTLGSGREFYIHDTDGTSVVRENATAEGINPGHGVRFRKAAGATAITTIDGAENLLALSLPNAQVAFEVNDDGVSVINYVDAVTDPVPQGYFGADRDFHSVPGSPTFATGDINNFAMSARGYLYVPNAGNWNFTVRSDDGFRLRIGSNSTVVAEYATGRAPGDTVAVVDFPQPGYYRYELTYFENGGGAQVEFLAQTPLLQNTSQLVGSGEDGLLVFRNLDIPPVVWPTLEPVVPGSAGYLAEFRKSGFTIITLADAQSLFNLPTTDSSVLAVASDNGVSVINYDDASGVTGLFASDRQIATPPLTASKGSFAAGSEDNFALRATGFIQVTNPGVWNFVVNSDDGFQLRLGTNLPVVSSFPTPRAMSATTNRVNLPVVGYYPFELIFFEAGGGALVEFFAFGPGQPAPKLVGDPTGVLNVFQSAPTGVRLTVTKSGNQAILQWPSVVTGFTLERSSALAGAATVWTPVAGSPSIVGQFWQQTDTISGAPRFYRLHR